MSDARRESPWRRVRECGFALCTAWLVVQNALLIGLFVTHRDDAVATALTTLPKVAAALAPLWVIPFAALCGLAIVTTLARDAASSSGAGRWETEHGRTR